MNLDVLKRCEEEGGDDLKRNMMNAHDNAERAAYRWKNICSSAAGDFILIFELALNIL